MSSDNKFSDEKTKDNIIPKVAETSSTEKSPKEAYFELLRIWVHQANLAHNAMACFPYYLAANFPQLFQQSNTGAQFQSSNIANPMQQQPQQIRPQIRFPFFRNVNEDGMDNQQRNEEIINRNGGYEFIIAPIWKRFAAETIDVLILFILKLMLTFTLLEIFDFNFGIDFNFDSFKNSLDEDYSDIFSITSDLVILEVVTKVLVCIYETLWTAHNYRRTNLGGATPGKLLLGIRLLHVDAVVALDPPPFNMNNNAPIRALLYPIENPGYRRALARAIVKNILITFLFPICFVVLFFKNNRTGYDIMTKTIVVEENSNPVFRQR